MSLVPFRDGAYLLATIFSRKSCIFDRVIQSFYPMRFKQIITLFLLISFSIMASAKGHIYKGAYDRFNDILLTRDTTFPAFLFLLIL